MLLLVTLLTCSTGGRSDISQVRLCHFLLTLSLTDTFFFHAATIDVKSTSTFYFSVWLLTYSYLTTSQNNEKVKVNSRWEYYYVLHRYFLTTNCSQPLYPWHLKSFYLICGAQRFSVQVFLSCAFGGRLLSLFLLHIMCNKGIRAHSCSWRALETPIRA